MAEKDNDEKKKAEETVTTSKSTEEAKREERNLKTGSATAKVGRKGTTSEQAAQQAEYETGAGAESMSDRYTQSGTNDSEQPARQSPGKSDKTSPGLGMPRGNYGSSETSRHDQDDEHRRYSDYERGFREGSQHATRWHNQRNFEREQERLGNRNQFGEYYNPVGVNTGRDEDYNRGSRYDRDYGRRENNETRQKQNRGGFNNPYQGGNQSYGGHEYAGSRGGFGQGTDIRYGGYGYQSSQGGFGTPDDYGNQYQGNQNYQHHGGYRSLGNQMYPDWEREQDGYGYRRYEGQGDQNSNRGFDQDRGDYERRSYPDTRESRNRADYGSEREGYRERDYEDGNFGYGNRDRGGYFDQSRSHTHNRDKSAPEERLSGRRDRKGTRHGATPADYEEYSSQSNEEAEDRNRASVRAEKDGGRINKDAKRTEGDKFGADYNYDEYRGYD